MPKLFEYLGITIFFYSNEHEPVHVHGRYQEYESKIEFILENGMVTDIIANEVKGKKPLPASKLSEFKHLANVLADEIVQSWVNYFVYNKKIHFKKIEGKLK